MTLGTAFAEAFATFSAWRGCLACVVLGWQWGGRCGCGGIAIRTKACDGGWCKELRWGGDVYVVKTRGRDRNARCGGDFWWRRGGPQ